MLWAIGAIRQNELSADLCVSLILSTGSDSSRRNFRNLQNLQQNIKVSLRVVKQIVSINAD